MTAWLQKFEETLEKDPSAFLESFPTYHLHSKPRPHNHGPWVFSREDERYENDSFSSDDVGTRTMIYDKIISAFSKTNYSDGLIAQFWAPVTIGGKLQLSTSGQPFSVSDLDSTLKKYRRQCVEYGYDIDVNSKFRGRPASVFLNRFPEIADIHPRVYLEAGPVGYPSLECCCLTTSIMIPICCPSQTSSSSDCIGVIECSSWGDPFFSLNGMNMTIKEVGLGVYNVQDCIPYKTINGLKLAKDQIQEALKIVCQSHHITLAQAWIASLDENHMHSSSSLEEAQTRQLLGEETYYFLKEYYDACDLIPLQPRVELVLKTLQDYEPRFCTNISKLGTYKVMGWEWSPPDLVSS